MTHSSNYLGHLQEVANCDVAALHKAEKNYGDSWKKRGGVGAFMMLARKWDRLENFLAPKPVGSTDELMNTICRVHPYDIFEAIRMDDRAEGIIDDIRDLRRYLMLVEAEMEARGVVLDEVKKDAEKPVSNMINPHRKPDVGGTVTGRFDADMVHKSNPPKTDGMEHPFGYDENMDTLILDRLVPRTATP